MKRDCPRNIVILILGLKQDQERIRISMRIL